MNAISAAFATIAAVAVFALPRRWAPLALLVGTCYMTLGQAIQIGPFNFGVVRLLIAVGVCRAILRGETLVGGLNSLDILMIVWAIWLCGVAPFHHDPSIGLVWRLGFAYNCCGAYFLLRVFCASIEDVERLCWATAVLLIPISAEMIYEHLAVRNLFAVFGGVPEVPLIREGRVRASGPFAHAILAGTVGAVCLPLILGIWRRHRLVASIGALVCILIVVASASSGPALSAAVALVAMCAWRIRDHMRWIRRGAVALYLCLEFTMKAPPYYLMARVDVAGGSTGWFRARLIESTIEHFHQWWLIGTDYTRDWMPSGVPWTTNHTDITNHYIFMGVLGGLPLMLLFIAIVVVGFRYVGRLERAALPTHDKFFVWALGASLFAHAATSVSISYFDQSVVFLYLTLAALGSAYSLNRRLLEASDNTTFPRTRTRPQLEAARFECGERRRSRESAELVRSANGRARLTAPRVATGRRR